MKSRTSIMFLIAAIVLLSFVAVQVMAAEKGETGKESTISLKQLPKAVKATLLAKAKGGKILEIEKSVDSKGVVTYSADVAFGKKVFDIEIAANGKFLGKEEDAPAPKAGAAVKSKASEADEAGEAGEKGESGTASESGEKLEPGESNVLVQLGASRGAEDSQELGCRWHDQRCREKRHGQQDSLRGRHHQRRKDV